MIETLPLYDSFLDFLVEKATPEEILAFRAPESEQEQARQLIERNSAGLLTEPEQQQLEQMLQFERLVTRLKAKAPDFSPCGVSLAPAASESETLVMVKTPSFAGDFDSHPME